MNLRPRGALSAAMVILAVGLCAAACAPAGAGQLAGAVKWQSGGGQGTTGSNPTRASRGKTDRVRLSKAHAALEADQLDEALRFYEALLAEGGQPARVRAESLYWAGMLRLTADPVRRDLSLARSRLGELKQAFPAWPDPNRRREVDVALALIDEIASLRTQSEAERSRREEADRQIAQCLEEQAALSSRADAARSAAEGLQADLGGCRAETASLREDARHKDEALKSMDEALNKVKEVLVGGKRHDHAGQKSPPRR